EIERLIDRFHVSRRGDLACAREEVKPVLWIISEINRIEPPCIAEHRHRRQSRNYRNFSHAERSFSRHFDVLGVFRRGKAEHSGKSQRNFYPTLCRRAYGLHRITVPQQNVMRTAYQVRIGKLLIRRHHSDLRAKSPQYIGLVDRKPMCYTIRETRRKKMRVIRQPLRTVGV